MASEAMGLAAAAGLNTRQAFKELEGSMGNSWMLGNRVPYMLDPDLPPYSAIALIAKDVVRLTIARLTCHVFHLFVLLRPLLQV